MAILNPVYGLIVPFLFVVTVPLAIFAGITTVLAFSVLMFRVSLVYLDIGLHMISQYVSRGGRGGYTMPPRGYDAAVTTPPSPVSSSGQLSSSPASSSPPSTSSLQKRSQLQLHQQARQQRRRRLSAGSATGGSVGTVTPISDGGLRASASGLIPSVGIERDFEGIGGWRLDDRGSDDDWTRINSRLELPLDRSGKYHHRSSSGGPTTPGESWLMMKPAARTPKESVSLENGNGGGGRGRGEKWREGNGGKAVMSPNSSRVRTPTSVPPAFTVRDREDGYFPPMMAPLKGVKKAVM
ncbi:hypothetical protein NKR23_g9236 [Pleurostoma richardsiae]|uniref:Uncharacterized protein n=1 Tax=Pleurostoma richardsiae TaxID=41990 RepID=A0AA38VF12_9PEZI|nr:hypothetical protein NKR23_g9236 [Pleurostoma richardsiae]